MPAISAGVYGYPKKEATAIAIRAMQGHDARFDRVIACAFDEEMARLYRDALETVSSL